MNDKLKNIAKKIAKKVYAGSVWFSRFGRGTDAKKIFNELAENDRYENGSQYSGGIGMKRDFRMVQNDPVTMDQAEVIMEKNHDKCDKYSSALCLPITEGEVKKVKQKKFKKRYETADKDEAYEKAMEELRSDKSKVIKVLKKDVKLYQEPAFKLSLKRKLPKNKSVKYYCMTSDRMMQSAKENSPKDALESMKRQLLGNPKQALKSSKETIEMYMTLESPLMAEFDLNVKKPAIHEVEIEYEEGTIKTSGKVTGYLFFGWARE